MGLGCLLTYCTAWEGLVPSLGPIQPQGQSGIQAPSLRGNNGALEGPPPTLCLVVRGGPGSGRALDLAGCTPSGGLVSSRPAGGRAQKDLFPGLEKVGYHQGTRFGVPFGADSTLFTLGPGSQGPGLNSLGTANPRR